MPPILLEITDHTLLKVRPVDSERLSEGEKLLCVRGDRFQIAGYFEAEGEYLKVCPMRRTYGWNAWYILAAHCQIKNAPTM